MAVVTTSEKGQKNVVAGLTRVTFSQMSHLLLLQAFVIHWQLFLSFYCQPLPYAYFKPLTASLSTTILNALLGDKLPLSSIV